MPRVVMADFFLSGEARTLTPVRLECSPRSSMRLSLFSFLVTDLCVFGRGLFGAHCPPLTFATGRICEGSQVGHSSTASTWRMRKVHHMPESEERGPNTAYFTNYR